MKALGLGLFVAILSVGEASADALVSKGKALSPQCSACHGRDGLSRDPEAPSLVGHSAFYLEKALVDYQKGMRQDRRMTLIAQGLSKEDIRALAAWYSAFEVSVTVPEL